MQCEPVETCNRELRSETASCESGIRRDDVDLADERVIGVDLLAPIALTQALLPKMLERGSGRIAMISSIAGKVGVPMRTASSASATWRASLSASE